MQLVWWNPALAAGVVLLVLGVGNWMVSANRTAEHALRARAVVSDEPVPPLDDFVDLTPETNRTLLKRLSRADADYTFADAKLDCYQVVESGRRMLSFAGLRLITGALVQSWWRRGAGAL